MDEKMFSLVAGVIFEVMALFHLVRIFAEWSLNRGLVSTEVGELGRPRYRFRPPFITSRKST
jgi:hypothetical protein